jgi:hypothetical protein
LHHIGDITTIEIRLLAPLPSGRNVNKTGRTLLAKEATGQEIPGLCIGPGTTESTAIELKYIGPLQRWELFDAEVFWQATSKK